METEKTELKNLLKQWKQRKKNLQNEELRKHFILQPKKEASDNIAFERCKEMILSGKTPDIDKLKGKLEERIVEFKRDFEDLRRDESKLLEKFTKLIYIQEKPEVKTLAEQMAPLVEQNIEVCNEMIGIFQEADSKISPLLEKEKRAIVKPYAAAKYARWDTDANKRKEVKLTLENKNLLKFAFLLAQWEKGDYTPNEELEGLLRKASGIPHPESGLEKVVLKKLITKGEADSALEYLNLAKEHSLTYLVRKEKLIAEDSPAPQGIDDEEELSREIFFEQVKANYNAREPQLETILSKEVARKLLEVNPSLVMLDVKEFDKYVISLKHYVSTVPNGKEDIGNEPSRFSSLDQLQFLLKSRNSNAAQTPVDRRTHYQNAFENLNSSTSPANFMENGNNKNYEFEVIDAIITKGMKCPGFVGEAYLPAKYVLNHNMGQFYSDNGDTQENRRKVKRTFLWLVHEGAILHHKGKGKSVDNSTVSINPHHSEIKTPILAEYIRDKLSRQL